MGDLREFARSLCIYIGYYKNNFAKHRNDLYYKGVFEEDKELVKLYKVFDDTCGKMISLLAKKLEINNK